MAPFSIGSAEIGKTYLANKIFILFFASFAPLRETKMLPQRRKAHKVC
jgi:hypothetical protein